MIETAYTLTKAEFVEAHELWCPQATKRLPGAWLMTGAYIAFALILGLSIYQIPIAVGTAFALWFVAYVALAMWRKHLLLAAQYGQLGDSARDISLRIDEFGYHNHKEGSGSCSIAWRRFTGWREGAHVFILGLNLQFITIPKSALSQDQQNEFRALLQASINSQPPH